MTGLARDDFVVEEEGRPQSVESFEPVVVRGGRPATLDEPPRLTGARLRAPSEGRCVLRLRRRHPRLEPDDGAGSHVAAPLPGDGRARGRLGHRRGSGAAAVVDGAQRLGVQAARGRRRPPRRPGRRRQLRRLGEGARAGVRTGGDRRDVRRRDRRRLRLQRRSRPVRRCRRSQRPGQAGAGHRAGQAPHRDQPRRPAAGARVAGATARAEVAGPGLRGLPAPAEDARLPRGNRRRRDGRTWRSTSSIRAACRRTRAEPRSR